MKEPSLEHYAQVIPREMFEALKHSAAKEGVSLDIEIASRLVASLALRAIENEANLFAEILQRKFNIEEAIAECQHLRHATHYLYEMEKLKLFLRFKPRLPRELKESFEIIDVKEATKIIEAELAAEQKE